MEQYRKVPSLEMHYLKRKMCSKINFDLEPGNYKLIFSNDSDIFGQMGLELICENKTNIRKILDYYSTNNIINLQLSHKGKLNIRFLSNISISHDGELIKHVYCIPEKMCDENYTHLNKGSSLYFVNFT